MSTTGPHTDSPCSAPGASRPAFAVAGHAHALRARARNAEALLAHYGEWSAQHLAGECASSPELADMERTIRRLRDLRAHLNTGSAVHTDSPCSAPGAGRPASAVAGLSTLHTP